MNETIRTLREQNNYSQAAIAAYLDISRQMYIKYENGDALPSVKVVTELSKFYRVPYDVILEDKLNHKLQQNDSADSSINEINADTVLELHDSASTYGTSDTSTSYYLTSFLEMLPKLVYKEQLKVLEKLSGIIQKATEEKLKPGKQMQNYNKLLKYSASLHLKSDGKKWTREELYER